MRTELERSQVEVQQCALSSEVGEELGEELARRKWRWKLMQTWSKRNWRFRRRRRRGRRRSRRRRRRRRRRTTALIKSNNPHLAGGEKHVLWSSSPKRSYYQRDTSEGACDSPTRFFLLLGFAACSLTSYSTLWQGYHHPSFQIKSCSAQHIVSAHT